MLRAEKAQVINDLNAVFTETGVVVVTHYKGLTVAEITDLRGRIRAAGASFRVTKNKLAQLAVDGTPFAPLSSMFKGPTANQVILYGRVTAVANSNPTCTTPAGSSPGNVTVTLTGTIAAANVAGYGKKLTVPAIDALALPLDDFYATINRGAYFKARCAAGVSPWKLRGTFLYSGNGGGGVDTINKTQACT